MASVRTRADNRKMIAAGHKAPITISGHGDAKVATHTAATSTPTFEITSLREHSNVLAMFTSCDRNCKGARSHDYNGLHWD